jgi:AraC-like DNA-binding protein
VVRLPISCFILNNSISGIKVHHCGYSLFTTEFEYLPEIKDHYIMNYVLRGKGTLTANGCQHPFKQNDIYMVFPGMAYSFKIDLCENAVLFWVGFSGGEAESYLEYAGITQGNPVLELHQYDTFSQLFAKLLSESRNSYAGDINRSGILNMMFSEVVENEDIKSKTSNSMDSTYNKSYYSIQKAIKFINDNYSKEIALTDIAASVGMEESYFCRLFKRAMNVSPWNFLMRVRMEKACGLLTNTTKSIREIASATGFQDPLYFSKVFKKYSKRSPLAYRVYINQFQETVWNLK